jgi:hypothetical protein
MTKEELEEKGVVFKAERSSVLLKIEDAKEKIKEAEKELEDLAKKYQYMVWYTDKFEIVKFEVGQQEITTKEETWRVFIPENFNKKEMRENSSLRDLFIYLKDIESKVGFWFESSYC